MEAGSPSPDPGVRIPAVQSRLKRPWAFGRLGDNLRLDTCPEIGVYPMAKQPCICKTLSCSLYLLSRHVTIYSLAI